MKRTILSLIAICSTSLALQAQMPQSYTLKVIGYQKNK